MDLLILTPLLRICCIFTCTSLSTLIFHLRPFWYGNRRHGWMIRRVNQLWDPSSKIPPLIITGWWNTVSRKVSSLISSLKTCAILPISSITLCFPEDFVDSCARLPRKALKVEFGRVREKFPLNVPLLTTATQVIYRKTGCRHRDPLSYRVCCSCSCSYFYIRQTEAAACTQRTLPQLSSPGWKLDRHCWGTFEI